MEPTYILGAGLSGLAAAYSLKKKYHAVRILEKERIGGWIQGPFGPQTFVKERSLALLTLIEELGLADKIIFATPQAKKRYLYYQGKMRTIPWQLWREILREPFQKRSVSEETVHEFFLRRFGPKTARLVGSALCQGVFAGDPYYLSVDAAFPRLKKLEQEKGSLLRAFLAKKPQSTLFTLQGGIQTLIQALHHYVQEDIVLENVHTLTLLPTSAFVNGQKTSRVISALPAYAIGTLLDDEELSSIPYNDIQIAKLTYASATLPQPGFGVLFPENQTGILGAIFDSEIFPSEHPLLTLTLMLRKASLAAALEAAKTYLHIQEAPLSTTFLELPCALAQYHRGHQQKIARLHAKYKNTPLQLIGSYLTGPSVNDCIQQASWSQMRCKSCT